MPEPLIAVRGLRDLNTALASLNRAVEVEIIADGIQAGAEVIRAAAAAGAPRRTGFLAKHIAFVYSVASGLATARVGPSGDAFYGGILNQGAVAHEIRPRRGRRRRGSVPRTIRKQVLASSARIFQSRGAPRGVVRHPGFTARPFLVQAAQQSVEAATQAMARAMSLALERVIGPLPKGQN